MTVWSLALQETHESSFTQIWNTLGLLAEIATLEGHPEETRTYRRQERETYAAFVGNRHLFEQRLESLITPIAAAALGDDEARQQMETALAELEAHDWHITTATHRLWAGERDWHTLAEDLGKGEALLILLVLETLASLEKASPSTQPVPEAIQALLPSPVLEDFQQEDQDDLDLELANLSPEAQQVLAALQAFRRQVKSDELEQGK